MNKPVKLVPTEPDSIGFSADEFAALVARGAFTGMDVALVEREPVKAGGGFTAADYEAMIGRDVFRPMRVELARGRLVRVAPAYLPHGHFIPCLIMALYEAIGKSAPLLCDVITLLTDDTVLSPDLVLATSRDLPEKGLPAALVALAIEVSHTTLKRDLGWKARDYAAAGIPHYWVVDILAKTTHVFAEPSRDGYRRHDRVRFADPLAIPGHEATITLA